MPNFDNIPEDCEFPQLHEIVAQAKLVQTLQRYLGPAFAAGELHVADCQMQRLYYRRGVDCQILFTASISDRKNHTIGQQVFCGTLCRSQSAPAYGDALTRQDVVPPQLGSAVVWIPEWAMLLWAYPHDPHLPGLPVMTNVENVLTLVKTAPEKFGLTAPPLTLTAEMIKYVPGKRCGYIYRMTPASLPSCGAHASHAVYGKAYRDSAGEKTYAIMQQLWDSEACQSGKLILPQPYSYDPDNKILWQEALSGKSFAKVAGTIQGLPTVAEEIGQRLAALHNLHLDLPQKMTFDFQVRDVQTSVAAINETFPRHAGHCSAVGQKLLAAAAQLGPGPLTPVHTGFKFSHIFATQRGIAFIDFDRVNLGDPGYDLGRFTAHLYRMQTDGKLDPAVAEQTRTHFCASYNRAAASPVSQERMNWFVASHLVTSEVYKGVKRMNAGVVSKFLHLAESLCPA